MERRPVSPLAPRGSSTSRTRARTPPRSDRLPPLHLRADLGRKGPRDGDRRAARDHRATPADRLRDRRSHPPRRRAPGGRAVPADAGAPRARARPRRPRRVRRPVPLDRGALGPARGDRRLRHPVPQPRADRLRRADLRDRRRAARSSRRRTGTRRTCSPRARAGSCPSTTRRPSPPPSAPTSSSPRRSPPREPRRDGSVPVARVARRSPRRRPRSWTRRTRSHRADGPSGVADLHLTSLRSDHLLTLVDDVGIVQHANGIIPNRDSGYCVDDVARLAVVSLALAQPRRRADSGPRSSTGRSPSCHAATGDGGMRNFMGYDRRWLDEPHIGDHVGRSVWALGEILATAWIPAVVVPARDLLDRLVGHALRATSRCERPPTRCSASRASIADRLDPDARRLLERLVEQLADAYAQHRDGGLELVRGRAQLRQRPAVAGADQRRQRARPERPVERGLESLRWLGDECGLDDGVLRLSGHHGRRRGEPAPGDRRRAAARRCGARRGRADRVRDHRREPSTESGRRGRSSGSSAATTCSGRSTTSRPAAAATGSARETLNQNEGAESTLAFHRAALLLDAAGVRAAVRERGARSRLPHERTASSSSATPRNPILTAEDWPYPVNAVFNPAAAALDGRDRSARAGRGPPGHLPPLRRPLGQRPRRLDDRARAAARARRRASRASSGASRIARVVWVEELDTLGDHLHRLRPGRAGRLSRHDRGLHDDRALRHRPASRGQERRAPAAPDRRPLGAPPPAEDRSSAAPTARSSSRVRRTSSAGALPSRCSSPATAPGGTRSASASARRRCGPSTAGCSSTTASRKPSPGDSTASASRCSTSTSRLASCDAYPHWILAPLAPYERTGDVPNVVFPCGLAPRRGKRRAPPLLRRRRQLHLPRHRATRGPSRRPPGRAGDRLSSPVVGRLATISSTSSPGGIDFAPR